MKVFKNNLFSEMLSVLSTVTSLSGWSKVVFCWRIERSDQPQRQPGSITGRSRLILRCVDGGWNLSREGEPRHRHRESEVPIPPDGSSRPAGHANTTSPLQWLWKTTGTCESTKRRNTTSFKTEISTQSYIEEGLKKGERQKLRKKRTAKDRVVWVAELSRGKTGALICS